MYLNARYLVMCSIAYISTILFLRKENDFMNPAKSQLSETIKYDKQLNLVNLSVLHIIHIILIDNFAWRRYRYIRNLRYASFCQSKFLKLWYTRRKNRLGGVLGFEIGCESFDSIGKGLVLHHGSVVINAHSKIGEFCQFHGDNCVGNNGYSDDCPILGNNINVGVGAKIIGPVYLADGIKVGAGAVVVSSFYEPNITIGGIPARKLK